MSWTATLHCTRAEADRAAARDDPFAGPDSFAGPDPDDWPSLAASETADGWALILYTAARPGADLLGRFAALAPSAAAAPVVRELADEDWVTVSQAGLAPVTIGRFHIYSGVDHPDSAVRPGQWPLRIDAGLAFGTGQHATTAGCVRAAIRLSRRRNFRNILDVGTGSGLLAFAAARLNRRARVTAADLDPVAVTVARVNARRNHLLAGATAGRIHLLQAGGVGHARIVARAPYDLVFANILAGPLAALAPSLAAVVGEAGYLVLAGLLQPQAARLRALYWLHGLDLVAHDRRAEWPTLIFRKRRRASRHQAIAGRRRQTANRGWQIDTI